DVRDESDRQGMRIVVEIRKDALAKVVLSKLYKFTPLQTSYGINNVALVGGRPMLLNVKDLIEEFIRFRLEVIVRRTRYDLRKAEERAHILEGLLIALDHLDQVIALIRASATVDEAKSALMENFGLSEIQSKAILDMRLQRLTGLERDKIKEEYREIQEKINYYKSVLDDTALQRGIVKDELAALRANFGDERRTEIVAAEGEISMEDLIKEEEVAITISHLGYIKRTPVSEFRTQGRGGKGARGSKTREEDFIEHLFVANTHHYLLFFTEMGRCYWLRTFEIPEAAKTASGRAIQNILAIGKEDKVKAYIIVPNLTDADFIHNHYIVFSTRQGIIKKTAVEAFSRPRTGGINAITINEGDQLLEARLTGGAHEVFLASKRGFAVRFPEKNVRPMGRSAAGVIGMTLADENDAVVGMVCVGPEDKDASILVVSEKGNGKRSEVEDYRLTNRGAKGVKTLQVTDKTGELVAIKMVGNADDLMITSKNGIVIRISVAELPVLGRATQGVRAIRLDEDDDIADVTVVLDVEEVSELPQE
ncbi:MAG: hypothetical protein RL386_1849, partial [Bacteroidota bacterium]